MQPNSQQPVQLPTEQSAQGGGQANLPPVNPGKKKKKALKIVLIIVGVVVLLAAIAFTVILVDYYQFQAKMRHEREVAKSAPDYTTPEGMKVVMKMISEKLGADAPISSIFVASKSVTLEVKKSEGLKQKLKLDQGTWREEYSERERHKLEKEVRLSSINLEDSWNKIVSASSCADPQAMDFEVTATSVVTIDLYCGTDKNQVVYTMNSKGKILENLDLETADGIYAAWLDILEVFPENERINMWGVNFADKGGTLLAKGPNLTVSRDGIQGGGPFKDTPILRKNYNTVPTTLPSIKASNMNADVIKQGLATYAQKCPGIELKTMVLQIPTGYPQYPAWISYSDLDTCVYEQRLANSDA